MNLSCPACGARYDMDAAINDADARRLMDLLAGLHPDVAKPLIRYLGLFRPEKNRLSYSRMNTLAAEIVPQIKQQTVTRNGTSYIVPMESWAAALNHLADRPPSLKLPLKTHGYLLEILAGGAEKVAAKVEAEQIEKTRTRPREGDGEGFKQFQEQLAELKRRHA